MKGKIFLPFILLTLILTTSVSAGFFDRMRDWINGTETISVQERALAVTELNGQIGQLNAELAIARANTPIVKYQCFDGTLRGSVLDCPPIDEVSCSNTTNTTVFVSPNQGCSPCGPCPVVSCRGQGVVMSADEEKVKIEHGQDGEKKAIPKDNNPNCIPNDPAISNIHKAASFLSALDIVDDEGTAALDSLSIEEKDKIKEDYADGKLGIPGQGTCHLNDDLTDSQLSCLLNSFQPWLLNNENRLRAYGQTDHFLQGFWDSLTDQEKEANLFSAFSSCS